MTSEEEARRRIELTALCAEALKPTGMVYIEIRPIIHGHAEHVAAESTTIAFDNADDAIALIESLEGLLKRWWSHRCKHEMF